jgi:hypothetical protein
MSLDLGSVFGGAAGLIAGTGPVVPVSPTHTKLSVLIGKYTDWDVGLMTAIALAESGGKVDAQHTNSDGSIDYGLLQVNSVHGYDPNCLLKAECNIDKAHEVWLSQGYGAWTTYNTGAWKLFRNKDTNIQSGMQGKASAAVGAGKDVVNKISSVGDLISWVTDPSTWARVGKGVMGSTLIILGVGGIVLIVANKAASSPVGKTVTGAATVIK